jgi:hypothetical protein
MWLPDLPVRLHPIFLALMLHLSYITSFGLLDLPPAPIPPGWLIKPADLESTMLPWKILAPPRPACY